MQNCHPFWYKKKNLSSDDHHLYYWQEKFSSISAATEERWEAAMYLIYFSAGRPGNPEKPAEMSDKVFNPLAKIMYSITHDTWH